MQRIIKKIVSIETTKFQIDIQSFRLAHEIEGTMSSGYMINYLSYEHSGDRGFKSECLDPDHVYRELKAYDINYKLIEFILTLL